MLHYDVRDFGGDIQKAVTAAAGGGRVYVPGGRYDLTAPLRFAPLDPYMGELTPRVTLYGDGMNATTIFGTDPDADIVQVARPNVSLQGMLLGGQGVAGAGRGVVINDARNGIVLCGVRLDDMYVSATGSEALYVPDGYPHLVNAAAYDRISILCAYTNVWFNGNVGDDLAYIGRWNTTHKFTDCQFTRFKGRALYLNGADVTSCRDCLFEDGDNTRPWVEGVGATDTLLDHCYFEDHHLPSTAVFTKHDRASRGWAESWCTFRRPVG